VNGEMVTRKSRAFIGGRRHWRLYWLPSCTHAARLLQAYGLDRISAGRFEYQSCTKAQSVAWLPDCPERISEPGDQHI